MYNTKIIPLIPSFTIKKKEHVLTNKEIVKQLNDITLHLSRHNLAFRKHRENWECNLRGNFKDLCSNYLLDLFSTLKIITYFGKLQSTS